MYSYTADKSVSKDKTRFFEILKKPENRRFKDLLDNTRYKNRLKQKNRSERLVETHTAWIGLMFIFDISYLIKNTEYFYLKIQN